MRPIFHLAIAALLAAFAAAQISNGDRIPTPGTASGTGDQPGAAAATIPEVPAGAKPMDRRPEPAGTPAAQGAPKSGNAASDETECHVKRAHTDTGFIVVCE